MLGLLPHQLPWWVAGPGIGLCVVALYGLANLRLGVSGSWLQLMLRVQGRRVTERWRLWFLAGLGVGALLAALLGSDVALHGYGELSAHLPPYLLVPLLLVVGGLIGYGARWAGGCTSGHGISGCAAGSKESFAATATFFGVAVLVSLAVHAATGGAV